MVEQRGSEGVSYKNILGENLIDRGNNKGKTLRKACVLLFHYSGGSRMSEMGGGWNKWNIIKQKRNTGRKKKREKIDRWGK